MGMHRPPPGGALAAASSPSHHFSVDTCPLKQKCHGLFPFQFVLLLLNV